MSCNIKNYKLSLANRSEFISKVDSMLKLKKAYYVTFSDKTSKRSLSANAVYQSWYQDIADHLAMTIPEATRYIKLHIGLPILCSNKDFGVIINDGLVNKGFYNVSYERQLAFMEKFPVTRLFTTEMHNKLRDDLQYFFGQQGLALEYKK